MERKQLHILATSSRLQPATCEVATHTFPKHLRRTSLLMCALRTFLDADKRNNYVKNYMALLTPEAFVSLPRCHFHELPLLRANLQIYMQRSCSIKSSKPDHKQGYFMCASCPFLGTGLEQRTAMTN